MSKPLKDRYMQEGEMIGKRVARGRVHVMPLAEVRKDD
jgi:hypothetical protein